MESWRKVWRDGIVPSLNVEGLEALRNALMADDGRVTQGSTTYPAALTATADWPCEAACPIGYSCWHGEHLETVGEVSEAFSQVCSEADERLGEPASTRWFIIWVDETPWHDVRRELLQEVELALDIG